MKNKTGCPHTSASQPCTICAEVYRALDALFPKGWEKDDILSLGSTVEGVVKTSFEDMQRAEAAEAENERLQGVALGVAGDALIDGLDLAQQNAQLQARIDMALRRCGAILNENWKGPWSTEGFAWAIRNDLTHGTVNDEKD